MEDLTQLLGRDVSFARHLSIFLSLFWTGTRVQQLVESYDLKINRCARDDWGIIKAGSLLICRFLLAHSLQRHDLEAVEAIQLAEKTLFWAPSPDTVLSCIFVYVPCPFDAIDSQHDRAWRQQGGEVDLHLEFVGLKRLIVKWAQNP